MTGSTFIVYRFYKYYFSPAKVYARKLETQSHNMVTNLELVPMNTNQDGENICQRSDTVASAPNNNTIENVVKNLYPVVD